MRLLSLFCLALLAVASLHGATAAVGCPLCQGASRTLGDELAAADAAVFARRVGLAPVEVAADASPDVPPPVAKTRFEIVEILKGEADLAGVTTIDVLYFGEATPETVFLLQATKLPELGWGAPFPLTPQGVAYIKQLPALPAGPDRLAFFIEHFEHPDQLLARDAYDEFAKAQYDEIKAVTDRLPREQLVAWIENPETVTSHRRLYLMLLGLCARNDPQIEEIALLEESIQAAGESPQPALDATIACYLTLTRGEGMPLIEERFLKNKDAVYSDTYSAIMALRFHGQDEQIIPRERVLEALKHLLDRPELADLIVADLARWQDWSAMDRLVELFKNADEKSTWVRVPVVQYLRACPLPEAKERIEELAKIDPKAVQRASLFVPLGTGRPAGGVAGQNGGDAAATGDAAGGDATNGDAAKVPPPAAEGDSQATPAGTGAAAAEAEEAPRDDSDAAGNSSASADAPQGSRLVVAVPLALGLGLLALLAFSIRT